MSFSPRHLLILSQLMGLPLAGCARDHGKAVAVQRTNLATPFDYKLDDPECQLRKGEAEIGEQNVFIWGDGAASEKTIDFNVTGDVSGRGTVSSSLIQSTYYGYHQRTTTNCTVDSAGSLACDKGAFEVVEREQKLKLCKTTGAYARDSIEGITLSTIANLETAKSSYASLTGAKPLTKVSLLVMPNFESIYNLQTTTGERTKAYTDTDNAAFAAAKDDNGGDDLYFIVYPRSQELSSDPDWQDIRLWEVPWVMAHEFSHQIFHTYYSKAKADEVQDDVAFQLGTQGIWKPKHGDFEIPGAKPSFSLQSSTRNVGTSEALSAVNEGFADLMGAYLINGDVDHWKNLPCFGATRDIRDATFADGKPKVLTKAVRDEFFSATESEANDDLCATSFQDEHHIGAIMAYGMNQILTANQGAVDQQARASKVLSWLMTFDAERIKVSSVSAEDIWILAIKSSLIAAKGTGESLTAAQCAVAKDVFPLYRSSLFKDDGAADGIVCQ